GFKDFGALRDMTDRHVWGSENGALLLSRSAVRDHARRLTFEPNEVEESQGWEHQEPISKVSSVMRKAFGRSGMNRPNQTKTGFVGRPYKTIEKSSQSPGVVDILRAVHGYEQ